MGNCFRLVAEINKFPKTFSRNARLLRTKANVRASAGRIVLGQKALAVMLLLLLGGMCFSYLALVNERVTKGFEIKKLEKQIIELEKSQKILEREAADLQAIQNIEQRLNLENYVLTTEITHLSKPEVAHR